MTRLFGGFVQELGVKGKSAKEFPFGCSFFFSVTLKALLLNLLELMHAETDKTKLMNTRGKKRAAASLQRSNSEVVRFCD